MAGATTSFKLSVFLSSVFIWQISSLALAAGNPLVPIPDSVKEKVRAEVDSGRIPSLALGVYDGGRTEYFVYGKQVCQCQKSKKFVYFSPLFIQNMSSGVNATEDTIYDLGSISKTFTSLLMGKLFAERKLNLWDPVDEYLPKELGLRGEDGTPINVRIISLCSSKVTVRIFESLNSSCIWRPTTLGCLGCLPT